MRQLDCRGRRQTGMMNSRVRIQDLRGLDIVLDYKEIMTFWLTKFSLLG